MKQITSEEIKNMKDLYEKYRNYLSVNRRTTPEVLSYLESRYTLQEHTDDHYYQVVIDNIIHNDAYSEKIPGEKLIPKFYEIVPDERSNELYQNREALYGNNPIFIGMESETTLVFIEGSSELQDQIVAFQGLDEYDLNNYYLVGNYIRCLEKCNQLHEVVGHFSLRK